MNMFDKKQTATVSEAELWRLPDLHGTGANSIETGKEREKAKQEGYAEGYAKGHEEGRVAASAENGMLVQQFRTMVGSLEDAIKNLDQAVADELVSLAAVMAQSIVRHELTSQPSHLAQHVTRLVADIPGTYEQITIYLHPDDLGVIKQMQQSEEVAGSDKWRLCEDGSLERGDCVVQTNDSILNAEVWRQIEVSLAAVVETQIHKDDQP